MGPVRLLASVLVAIAAISPAAPVTAQELKLFDAHPHYNQEPTPFYSRNKGLGTFRRNRGDPHLSFEPRRR